MGKVTVAYRSLEASEKKLGEIDNYIGDVLNQIGEIKDEVSTLGDSHGGCFPKTIVALDDLNTSFKNYKEVVSFMQQRCKDARVAFRGMENKAIKEAKELTDPQKAFLINAGAMLGMTLTEDDLNNIKVYGNRNEITDKEKFSKSTMTQSSSTWNNVFQETEDKDNKTNSIKANGKFTESIFKDADLDTKSSDKSAETSDTKSSDTKSSDTTNDKQQNTTDSDQTSTDSNDSTENYNEDYSETSGGGGGGSSSGGGGGGGSSSGGGGGSSQARKLSPSAPTDTSKEKAEAKKAADSAKKQAENTKTETSSPKKETVTPVEPNTQKTDSETTKPSTDGTNKDTTTTDTTPSETKPTESTPSETKPAESTSQSEITTPPSTEKQTLHVAGGSYSGNEGYVPSNDNYSGNYAEPSPASPETHNTTEGAPVPAEEDVISDITEPLEETTIGSDYTKIPASTDPITSSSSKSGGSSVIPIAAGLSAAAAAGIGAKAYMDRKRNNSDEDEFDTEEWTGDETMDIEYEDQSAKEEYLDDSDDYGYQDAVTEKYGARNNEELADLQ